MFRKASLIVGTIVLIAGIGCQNQPATQPTEAQNAPAEPAKTAPEKPSADSAAKTHSIGLPPKIWLKSSGPSSPPMKWRVNRVGISPRP